MIFFRGWQSGKKGQAGFTLLELLVSIAILGFIMSGVSLAVMQMMTVHAASTNRVTAIREVQNAGYWMSIDTQQAQTYLFDDPATEDIDELLYLSWADWDSGVIRLVIYNLDEDRVVRTEYRDGEFFSQRTVAHFISAVDCSLDGSVIKLTIVATVDGFQRAVETRVYQVVPRPAIR